MTVHDDFLDEIIAERAAKNPGFPALVEARVAERRLLRELARHREQLGLSQTKVAARMDTSQSAIARLERGETDPRISTVERFVAALGKRIEWRIVDAPATRETLPPDAGPHGAISGRG